MIITDLTTLKINELTKAQYNAALAAGTISETELYMTPESESDSDVFTITLTRNSETGEFSADKGITEIVDAYNSGKILRSIYNGSICYLSLFNCFDNGEYSITFSDGRYETVYFNYFSSTLIISSDSRPYIPTFETAVPGSALMVDSNGNLRWVNIKPTITTTTLTASNWDSTEKTYSFESTYPSASYDIEIDIDGDNCTDEQLEAWIAAKPLSSSTNKIIAKGDIPSVDIPIILTATPK